MSNISVEDIKALYFDEDALILPNYKLIRMDGGDIRFYYKSTLEELKPFPSVTSVIQNATPMSYGLLKWFKSMNEKELEEYVRERQLYGTLMHILIAELMQNELRPLDEFEGLVRTYCLENDLDFKYEWVEDLQKDILSFTAFCQERKVRPLAIEMPLVSEQYQFAGCIDLICELEFKSKTVTAIVDFKSGRKGFYDNHAIQLMMYKAMWEENMNRAIDMIFNWAPSDWKNKPSYKLKNQSDEFPEELIGHIVGQFRCTNKTKPSSKFKFTGSVNLNGDLSENYQNLTPEQILLGEQVEQRN